MAGHGKPSLLKGTSYAEKYKKRGQSSQYAHKNKADRKAVITTKNEKENMLKYASLI